MDHILIERRFFDLIKSGEKQIEVRKWFRPELVGKEVGLKLLDTNKVEGVVTIADVEDLTMLTEDDKDQVLDIAKVPYEFRESYPCDYAYLIKDFKNIH